MSRTAALDTDIQSGGMDLNKVLSQKSVSLRTAARGRIEDIRKVTAQSRFLALNAMIEATRAGAFGNGFSVVAKEVREVADTVEKIADGLDKEISSEVEGLISVCEDASKTLRNERLVDLALNAVELIDRNLYERTCDVRWWATDSAIVDCAATKSEAAAAYASKRLGVILSAYTVYLDLWVIGLDGTILANGRPDRYRLAGTKLSGRGWLEKASKLKSGDEYSVGDIDTCELLGGAQVATYCASIRENGEANGRPLGTLAIHFDWEPQARAIVEGVRLSPSERETLRVLLVDAAGKVIASTQGKQDFRSSFRIETRGHARGHHSNPNGELTAFHLTPGYETYAGLGWYGVIASK